MNEVIDILRNLVEIPSVFPKEKEIARFCGNFLKDSGFNVEFQEIEKDRYNVVAIKGKQEKCIILSGHLDTVPAYNYTDNPYEIRIKDDKISGLGSWDMKSGIAIILSAASKINPKNIGIKIVLTSDEENNSLGGYFAYTKESLQNAVLAITPEIIDNVDANSNENPLILGRRGRVVYKLVIKGISGHGAGLHGISAITIASKLIYYIERLDLKDDDFLGKTSVFIRKVEGESTSLSLPEECSLYLDVHYGTVYTEESLLKEIESLIRSEFKEYISKGVKISIEVEKRNTPYLKPYVTYQNNEHVKRTVNILSKYMKNIKISAGLTVADDNLVGSFGVPVITLGPIGGEAHSSKEWVSKKSIEQIEKMYVEVLNGLSGY